MTCCDSSRSRPFLIQMWDTTGQSGGFSGGACDIVRSEPHITVEMMCPRGRIVLLLGNRRKLLNLLQSSMNRPTKSLILLSD